MKRRRKLGSAVILWALLWGSHVPAQDYPRHSPLGSAYMPLHSWVYPALERLAALGYIRSDFRGMRPWTRTECARLTDEAGEAISEALYRDESVAETVIRMHRELEDEFAPELQALGGAPNRSIVLESAYARVLSLSGPLLTDGYHFGQTIANDYGRPFRRGTNVQAGGALRAVYGPLFAYGWAEYQHAPSAPPLALELRERIAQMDRLPVRPSVPFEPIRRFRLLDAYAGVNWKNWQVSVGRQSLWWGSSESGPLLLSNNAEPINMLRLNRVVPFKLPSFLGIFGPIRVDFFVGRLGGHQVARRPWLQGQRIGFKMAPWFEFGATHTATFGGEGRPNGPNVFFRSLFGLGERRARGVPVSPGEELSDQHLSFDFAFRVGRYLTYYGEFLGSDDPHPFNAPSRMAVNTGLYFPRLPVWSRLDLRLEGFYTDTPDTSHSSFKAFLHYWHHVYRSGYTNNGNILGHSIGRAGVGFQAWTSYWFSPRERLQLSFRRNQVSDTFVPNGAQWSDFAIRHDRPLRAGLYLRTKFQVQRLNYPLLFGGVRTNAAAVLELGYSPEVPRP